MPSSRCRSFGRTFRFPFGSSSSRLSRPSLRRIGQPSSKTSCRTDRATGGQTGSGRALRTSPASSCARENAGRKGRCGSPISLIAAALSHNPHFVPADLAVADRHFDAPIAFVRDFACLFPPVDLMHVTGDAAITEVEPVACLELEVELIRRRTPRQLLPDLVDPTKYALGGDPFNVRRQERVDGFAVAALSTCLERCQKLPGNLHVLGRHRLILERQHPEVTALDDSPRRTRSGRSPRTGASAVGRGNLPIRLPTGCVDCRDRYFA